MAPIKSPKTAKYTYAERVLGAFTQAKKNQRRHSVHIATLRAQVKKSAESKKDKLGPQWAHWVGKAVQRLENDGILEPSEPTGTVALTPSGKKMLSSVRRSLNIPANVEPSAIQEELILKQVTQTGTRGIKRPRTSRASNISLRHDSEDDEDGDFRTPKRTNKRSRPSVSVKSSPSKMTKAQLQAELESLKIAHQQILLRGTSPLTDLSDDDGEQTNGGEELHLRRRRPSSGANRPRESGSTARDAVDDNLFATPTTPSRLTAGRPRSVSPTPDVGERPSSAPDVRSEHDDYEMDPLFTPASSLATPQASPTKPTQVEVDNTLIERLERKYSDLKSQHDKVVLEVSERDARILSLQTDINDLSKKAIAAMADKNSEFIELETTSTNRAENFERCIAEQLATITALEREREEANKKLSSLQQALRAAEENVVVVTQLEDTIRDLGSQKKSVEEQLEVEQSKNCDLFEEIRNQNVANESLLEQLADLSTKIRLFEDEQANRDTATQHMDTSLSESRHDAQVLRETVTNLEESSHSKHLELVQSNSKVEELEKALDNLKRLEQEIKTTAEHRLSLLEAEKVEKERLIQTVANKEQDILNLTENASVVKSSMEKLKAELFLKEAAMQQLHGELAVVREELTIAEGSLVASSEKHQAERSSLTSRLSSIEGSLVSANLEAKNLRTQLESAEIAHASVRAQVVERDIDLSKIRNELESERKRGNSLETELIRAKENTVGLEETIQGVRASKDADEKTIESLKNVFATYRESQMHFLMVMEEKVNSANLTPLTRDRKSVV